MNNQRPIKPPNGICPNEGASEGANEPDSRSACPIQCKYNYFESDELTIHTYELKCIDCGWRDTRGYRSDDEDEVPENPGQCPFCEKCDLTPGKNPCDA